MTARMPGASSGIWAILSARNAEVFSTSGKMTAMSKHGHDPSGLAKETERVIARVLGLLKLREYSYQQLRLKINCPSDKLKVLLEWGEVQGLWFKNPISEAYTISDTGELILANSIIKEMLKTHPPKLDNLKLDTVLKKLKYVELRLKSLMASLR